MTAFAKRNLKLYLRDRGAVIFSLLAVFIVIGLYVLFLGDVYTGDLKEFEGAEEMMNNWVMAGVLAITSMTTTLGMLGTMVRDKTEGIEKDFYVAPVKNWHMAAGYMLSAYAVGVVMTFLALLAAEIYIVAEGGTVMGIEAFFKVAGVILLTAFMNTAIALFLVTLFRSLNAYTTANIVLGTLIGFLTGIYLPIGSYPPAVQWIVKLFPVSHAALLFRNIMMEPVMETAFSGAPESVILEIKEDLGIIYVFGSHELTVEASLWIMAAIALVFFLLACFHMSKKRE